MQDKMERDSKKNNFYQIKILNNYSFKPNFYKFFINQRQIFTEKFLINKQIYYYDESWWKHINTS